MIRHLRIVSDDCAHFQIELDELTAVLRRAHGRWLLTWGVGERSGADSLMPNGSAWRAALRLALAYCDVHLRAVTGTGRQHDAASD